MRLCGLDRRVFPGWQGLGVGYAVEGRDVLPVRGIGVVEAGEEEEVIFVLWGFGFGRHGLVFG